MDFNELKELIRSGNTKGFIEQAEKSCDTTLYNRDNGNDDNDKIGCSLLDLAAIENQLEIVTFLCKKYPKLLIPHKEERSAIHYAARYGSFESLQFLINRTKDLEHKDHDQKTALELSIKCGSSRCARILLNHGAELPIDIKGLIELIKPFELTLYCEPDGTYELISEEEKRQLDILGSSWVNPISRQGIYARKSYFLKINLEIIENILLTLIDKYLYLCKRIYKEKRQEMHCDSKDEIIKSRVKLSKAKRKSLLKVIRLIIFASNDICNVDQSLLVNDKAAESKLLKYIEVNQDSKKRYFGDDLSDDSDCNEEDACLEQLTNISVNGKCEYLWKQITQVLADITKDLDRGGQLDIDVTKTGIYTNLKNRAKIIYGNSDHENATKIIESINSSPPEKLTKLLNNSKPIFILGTRGINYMLDRWNANARRHHRKIDELYQPQYSESVLKTLPYDYYTDLDRNHDFHRNKKVNFLLQEKARRLSEFLQTLNSSDPCISYSANHKDKSYLFNSVGDCLQDHFSNNIDDYLENLANKRSTDSDFWRNGLKNSFNPSIAIGSRPYHALKYTFNLKAYHRRSMSPRYWNDGTIEYPHVGKVYLSLHLLQEMLSKNGPNNLSVQDRRARVSLGDQFSPEKELSYLGFMPGGCIFYQFVAKFPSFKGKWKERHKSKYGLDKEVYEGFKRLFSKTQPETPQRNQVINLLAEWLCAYHEVVLIEIAKEEALQRGGILVYLDRDEKLTLTPDNGRIFTRGEKNSPLRNEVHMMRELRIELTKHLAKHKKNEKIIPTFNLIKLGRVIKKLESLLNKEEFLKTITSKVKLTVGEQGLGISAGLSNEQLVKVIAVFLIERLIENELYSKTFYASYKKFANLLNLYHLYTDFEIEKLLKQASDSLRDVAIYDAQHPLIEGRFEEESQKLFIDALKRIFRSNQTAVMPIEISQTKLDEGVYLNVVAIHWIGLVISKVGNNSFKIELIDPAHSPNDDIEISLDRIPVALSKIKTLLKFIRKAAGENHVTVDVCWLKTQQSGGLDCGVWTVDNLIRRAQNSPLRTQNDINKGELRRSQHYEYVKYCHSIDNSDAGPFQRLDCKNVKYYFSSGLVKKFLSKGIYRYECSANPSATSLP